MTHPRLKRLPNNTTQAKAERFFVDTAQRYTHSQSQDATGSIVDTWSAGATFSCALDIQASREITVDAQTVTTDGRLFVARGTTLDPDDRIRVTHRYTLALGTTIDYNIIGDPQDDALVKWMDLQRVDPWKSTVP